MTTEKCSRCRGTGVRRDATLADRVAAAGTTLAQCSTCRGSGTVAKLTMAEMIAEAERFLEGR